MRSNARGVSWTQPLIPALALALGSGCGDLGPPVATKIEISPAEPVLQDARDTLRLIATVRDHNGEEMPWVPVTWSIRTRFVAEISKDGLVTGRVGKLFGLR